MTLKAYWIITDYWQLKFCKAETLNTERGEEIIRLGTTVEKGKKKERKLKAQRGVISPNKPD